MAGWKRWCLAVVLAAACLPTAARAAFDFPSIEQLPPGEQYRQLSLLSLVAGGVEPALTDLLRPLEEAEAARAAAGEPVLELSLDDYVTPLVRIVDQDSLLANASQLFRFARQNSAEIQRRMTRIAHENPILISMVDVSEIAADAIIIRNAIADSVAYSHAADAPDAARTVKAFRDQTVYLRNMMEYNQFQRELSRVTDEAIVDLGGRLDAYQRMFDEEVDPDLMKRRIESAEIMSQQTGHQYEDRALQRNSELLKMLILMESQVK
ncbi:MAG: hypothetical protein PVJ33_07265 [Lysobacterales bacterium]|jgi:hypothetical protein